MPILDFETCPEEALRNHDLVVVGAGAAGILLTVTLARRGLRVLLLESGHAHLDDERQALNLLEETGQPLSAPVWGRKRVLGGTTTAWGGQSLPFTPFDLSARPWRGAPGWPISWDALSPHYDQANRFMGVDTLDYDLDLGRQLRRPDPGFDPTLARFHFSKWSPRPDFRKAYRGELRRRSTTVLNAHVVAMNTGADGQLNELEICSWRGRHIRLHASRVILAQGTIESCRQLLLAARACPGAWGDGSGNLGLAFMEHPALDVGQLDADDPRHGQSVFGVRVRRGRKFSVRVSAADDYQRRHGLLNASATFFPRYPAGKESPYAKLRRMLERPYMANARIGLAAATGLLPSLGVLISEGLVVHAGARLQVQMMIEQEADPANRITLSNQVDRFNRSCPALHWRVGETTWATAHTFAHTLQAELLRLKIGHLALREELAAPRAGANPTGIFSDANHHMGGARMSERPNDGVVDPNLRVWGQQGVYVCSAAAFPTGSHSNPTLTLLALADRLADHLGSQQRSPV